MATYAIGDVQGCFTALERLLARIEFNASRDTLWFTGDLVNRGTQSLETLRWIKKLDSRHKVVLGNHDLHLLALAYQSEHGRPDDTLNSILTAPDRGELLSWLIQQPLIHHDATLKFTMIHAGLAATWDLVTAIRLGNEVSQALQQTDGHVFFQQMYGNTPAQWSEALTGWDRLRCILNFFTRARFCFPDGSLELTVKENLAVKKTELIPWFQIPHRRTAQDNIIFGHWAALRGITHTPHTFALDTGCVWGDCLTAMRLEDLQRFSISCT